MHSLPRFRLTLVTHVRRQSKPSFNCARKNFWRRTAGHPTSPFFLPVEFHFRLSLNLHSQTGPGTENFSNLQFPHGAKAAMSRRYTLTLCTVNSIITLVHIPPCVTHKRLIFNSQTLIDIQDNKILCMSCQGTKKSRDGSQAILKHTFV